MDFPSDLKYTREHEWIRVNGDKGTVGITVYAQDQLGDIVFVEMPDMGRSLKASETLGVVESVKTVSDIYTPVAGEVIGVNSDLEAEPELMNQDPYGKGWILKIKLQDPQEVDTLLSAEAYQKYVEEEAG